MSPPVSFSLLRFGFAGDTRARTATADRRTRHDTRVSRARRQPEPEPPKDKERRRLLPDAFSPRHSRRPRVRAAHIAHNDPAQTPCETRESREREGAPGHPRRGAPTRGAGCRGGIATSKQQRLEVGRAFSLTLSSPRVVRSHAPARSPCRSLPIPRSPAITPARAAGAAAAGRSRAPAARPARRAGGCPPRSRAGRRARARCARSRRAQTP